MNYTIHDVAKKAGVSIATVSRVLNGKDRVKEETRKKIISVIEELNYVTNFSATTLRKNRTNVIGVIVPELTATFYAEVIKGIENKANESGVRMVVCDAGNNLEKERDSVRFLYDRSVDGMIFIMPKMTDEELIRIKCDRRPIVLFGRNMQQHNIPTITVDNRFGVYAAIRHFYSHGFMKIAYIGGIEENHLPDRRERLEGYKQAIIDCEWELRPEYIENGLYYEEAAGSAFARLMKLPVPPDAVFCGNDEMALGVLKAARKMGFKIPEQIGLIGFDNIRICQYTSPTLTTVSQPAYNIGVLCCEKLIHSINNLDTEVVYSNLLIQPELVVRESCGC